MNVSTINVTQAEAQAKLNEYEAQPGRERTPADAMLRKAYHAAADGARILHLESTLRETGLNDQGQPKLAMARADWLVCHFWPGFNGAGTFAPRHRFFHHRNVITLKLHEGTFTQPMTREACKSPVPHIPPAIRPRPSYLRAYWILFEVEAWESYPVDPFLLRPLGAGFYRVDAEWELTPLEATLLAALNA